MCCETEEVKLKSRPGAAATSAPVQVGGGSSFGVHRGISALQHDRHGETWSSWVCADVRYGQCLMVMRTAPTTLRQWRSGRFALYLTARRNGRGRKKTRDQGPWQNTAREQDDLGSWDLEEPLEVVDEQQRVSDKWVAWTFLFKSRRSQSTLPHGPPSQGILVLGVQHRTAARQPRNPVAHLRMREAPSAPMISLSMALKLGTAQEVTAGIGFHGATLDHHHGNSLLPGPGGSPNGTGITTTMLDLKMGPIPHREASRPPGLVLSLQHNLILSAPAPECTVKMNESRETGAPVSLPSRHELPDNLFFFCNGSVQRPQMSCHGNGQTLSSPSAAIAVEENAIFTAATRCACC